MRNLDVKVHTVCRGHTATSSGDGNKNLWTVACQARLGSHVRPLVLPAPTEAGTTLRVTQTRSWGTERSSNPRTAAQGRGRHVRSSPPRASARCAVLLCGRFPWRTSEVQTLETPLAKSPRRFWWGTALFPRQFFILIIHFTSWPRANFVRGCTRKKLLSCRRKKGEEALFTSCKRHFKKKIIKPEQNPGSLFKNTNGTLENAPSMLLKAH